MAIDEQQDQPIGLVLEADPDGIEAQARAAAEEPDEEPDERRRASLP